MAEVSKFMTVTEKSRTFEVRLGRYDIGTMLGTKSDAELADLMQPLTIMGCTNYSIAGTLLFVSFSARHAEMPGYIDEVLLNGLNTIIDRIWWEIIYVPSPVSLLDGSIPVAGFDIKRLRGENVAKPGSIQSAEYDYALDLGRLANGWQGSNGDKREMMDRYISIMRLFHPKTAMNAIRKTVNPRAVFTTEQMKEIRKLTMGETA